MSELHPHLLQPPVYDRLKDLCLTTVLAHAGRPLATLVTGGTDEYSDAVARIRGTVRRLSGVELPVVDDRAAAAALPLQGNLIVLGNRSTNRAIGELYNRFHALLDLRYPGAGGYEVRSLHNPCGNGHNVLFVGGSDAAGVTAAAAALERRLEQAGGGPGELSVGWLMEIRLGAGVQVPADLRQVQTWEASAAYTSAGYFGWNSISKRLALYYMTGDPFHAREALRLAFPDETAKGEIADLDGELIENKDEPLSGPYHYGATMLILFWDLVEESPVFSDAERLRVTNAFAKHLGHPQERGWREAVYRRYGQGPDAFGEPPLRLGDRHELWSHVGLFCLSRYFQTYYPAPVWQHCFEGARWYFSAFHRHYWVHGLFEVPAWYCTTLAPLLTYMLLSGDREPLASGTLPALLRGQEIVVSGTTPDPVLAAAAIDYLHKAAYLLQDGRYLHYLRRTGMDLGGFRVGQSFWPEAHLAPTAPTDRAGRWTTLPMPEPMWQERAGGEQLRPGVWPHGCPHQLRWADSFIFGSFRSTVDGTGDFILIETYKGLWWDLYHTLKIATLRLAGQTVLAGTLNQVLTRLDGQMASKVAMDCAVPRWHALGGSAVVVGEVPDAAFCTWRRTLLQRVGRYALVTDELSFREGSAHADIDILWQGPGQWQALPVGGAARGTGAGAAVEIRVCDALETQAQTDDGVSARMLWRGAVTPGQRLTFFSLVALDHGAGLACRRLADRAAALGLPEPAVVTAGSYAGIDGELAVLAHDHLYGQALTTVAPGNAVVLQASAPVDLDWDFTRGVLELDASTDLEIRCGLRSSRRLTLDGEPLRAAATTAGLSRFRLSAGRHCLRGARPAAARQRQIDAFLDAAAAQAQAGRQAESADRLPLALEAPPLATALATAVPGRVSSLLCIPGAAATRVCAAVGDSVHVWALPAAAPLVCAADAPVQCLHWWPEPGLLLAGCKDGKVIAFEPQTGARRWVFQAEMDSAVRRAAKPYWFNTAKGHEGVHGLHSGVFLEGRCQAFVGGACTLEIIDDHGGLLRRLPVFWGPGTVFGLVPQADGSTHLLVGREPADTHAVVVVSNRTEYVPNMLGPDPRSFHDVPPDHTDVWVWGAMYRGHIVVDDLDGDGQLEVVSDITGAWNRVTIWDRAATPLHNAQIGPGVGARGKLGTRQVRDLAVADLEGSGRKTLVVGTGSGWVIALDSRCRTLWSRRLPVAPTVLQQAPLHGRPCLVVGCEDGAVLALDARGNVVGRNALAGGPTHIAAAGPYVVLATERGEVRVFDLG